MTQSVSVLTGATAGATESFVVVPFELVKVRLQDKAQAGKYLGAGDAVVKIVRQEGILALYNGLEATLWRHIWWNAGYFGCIHSVRASLPKATTKREDLTNNFIAGLTGGTFGTMINTPFVLSVRGCSLILGCGQVADSEYRETARCRTEI